MAIRKRFFHPVVLENNLKFQFWENIDNATPLVEMYSLAFFIFKASNIAKTVKELKMVATSTQHFDIFITK